MKKSFVWLCALSLSLCASSVAMAAPAPIIHLAGSPAHAMQSFAWNMVKGAPDAITLGTPAKALPQITMFLDPNYSLCHEFYGQLQPLIQAHQVSVRIVPVGLIKPTSLGKAAHIEEPFMEPGSKATPEQLLAEDEGGFQKGSVGGHISPVSNPIAKQVVQRSTTWFWSD